MEKLSPGRVAQLLPHLLEMHLLQHELDGKLTKRILKQFVLQLDFNHVFFLKDEAEAAAGLDGDKLDALAAQALNGDLSHFKKLLKDFLDVQIGRDAAFYGALETRAHEIKALAAGKEKDAQAGASPVCLEDEIDKIDRGERVQTQAERERRVLLLTASYYKMNATYLSENEAFKLAVQSMRDERNRWLNLNPDEEAPKLFLKSFMTALDPHSDYFDEDEEDDVDEQLERSFVGIGLMFRPCPLGALVEEVLKGGPSDRSGKFIPGDQILAVDGAALAGLTIDKIIKKIKGEEGAEVKLTILKREGCRTENIVLKREKIELAGMLVEGKKIETKYGPVGIISVQSFYDGVHRDVREKLRTLGAEKPLAGVVLDLRYNQGGLLDEAIDLANLFIESGPVVGERDCAGEIEWTRKKKNHPEAEYLGPLVVLVNQFSASASEIVAGTLKDYGRAVIVGATQTFGKGTVQCVIPLEEYNFPGEIHITTHQYFLAGGSSVQLKGVEPDVYIPGPKLLEEEGMLERSSENTVPWNRIKGGLDSSQPEVKAWRKWKSKTVKTLQENSKQRVDNNLAFKDAFDSQKTKANECLCQDKPRSPDEPPPLAANKSEEKDLQAEEAAAVAADMIATWPRLPELVESKAGTP